MKSLPAFAIAATVACTALVAPVFAHRADYLGNTLVFETLPAGELESELFLDAGWRGPRGAFTRQTLGFEYGISSRWMVDGRMSFSDARPGGYGPSQGFLEVRTRLGEEGQWWFDPGFVLEGFWGRGDDDDTWGLAPTLILSRDFGWLHATLNFEVEIPLAGEGEPDFVAALGLHHKLGHGWTVGVEWSHEVREESGFVMPQIWWQPGKDLIFKAGTALGYGEEGESYARFAVEWEF